MNGNDNCEVKMCSCSNGQEAVGEFCPTHGQEFCTDCLPGHNMQNNACSENLCTCDAGEAATGTECPTDSATFCLNCFQGYYRADDGSCLENICSCTDGEAATGVGCPTHEDTFCLSCNPGYFQNGNNCDLKVCTCDNGIAGVGESCPTHDQEFCTSCDVGQVLLNNICMQMCDSAYYYTGSSCNLKVCSCENGEAATGDECPEHNMQYCTECEFGSSMVDVPITFLNRKRRDAEFLGTLQGGFLEMSCFGVKSSH